MDSVEKVVVVPRKLFEDASSCSEWTRDFALAQIGKLVLEAEDDTDEAFEQLRDDRDQWRQMVGQICATIPTVDVLASTETSQKTVDYFKALQQRLADAEKRNAELVELLAEHQWSDWEPYDGHGKRAGGYYCVECGEPKSSGHTDACKINAALNPVKSGASS